ncbi:MAG: hypothetical protein Q9227_002220 [Pyrenula ochraceoflavens]
MLRFGYSTRDVHSLLAEARRVLRAANGPRNTEINKNKLLPQIREIEQGIVRVELLLKAYQRLTREPLFSSQLTAESISSEVQDWPTQIQEFLTQDLGAISQENADLEQVICRDLGNSPKVSRELKYRAIFSKIITIQRLCGTVRKLTGSVADACNVQIHDHASPKLSLFSRTCLWLIGAKRPLKSDEILEAIISPDIAAQWNYSNTSLPTTLADLIVDCWGLFRLDEDGAVELMCPPDLLQGLQFGLPDSEKISEASWKADEEIAKRCLHQISCHSPPPLFQNPLKQSPDWCSSFGGSHHILCDYAFENWHHHYRIAEPNSHTLPGLLHDMFQSLVSPSSRFQKGNSWRSSIENLNQGLLFSAWYNFEVLGKTYLEMGADPDSRSSSIDPTPLHISTARSANKMIDILLARGANIGAVDGIGRSALHVAACVGFLEGTSRLIREGADINAVTHLDVSALSGCIPHCASPNRIHTPMTNESSSSKERDYVLRDGLEAISGPTSIFQQRLFGLLFCELGLAERVRSLTPLHLAVYFNHLHIVEMLLKLGADTNIQTMEGDSNTGVTALQIAEDRGNKEIVRLLEDHCSFAETRPPAFDYGRTKSAAQLRKKIQNRVA